MGVLLMEMLPRLLAGAYRRRWAFMLPLLIGIPLSLLAAYVAPQTYVARTMFMLQEGSTDVPLARDLRSTETSNDKVSGIKALLHSDRVVGESVREIYGADLVKDTKPWVQKRNELENRITLWSEAPDFIELRLSGSKPEGLGQGLEIIVTKLMENLLLSDTGSVLSAPQLIIARSAKRIADIEARVAELDRMAAGHSGPEVAANSNAQGDDKSKSMTGAKVGPAEADAGAALLASKSDELQSVTEALQGSLAALGAPVSAFSDARDWLAQQEELAIRQLAEVTAAAKAVSAPNASGPLPAQMKLDEIDRAQKLELKRRTLSEEVHRMRDAAAAVEQRRSGTVLAASFMSPAALDRARRDLRAELDSARASYRTFSRRFQDLPNSNGISFLRAPERILVIDPPKDPTLPVRSRTMVFLIGIVGSLLMGLGAAFIAEQTDTRVRGRRDLMSASKAPFLGRIA